MNTGDWLKQKKIAVLYGGWSAERDISIKSGTAVLNALLENGYNAAGVDVTKEFIYNIKSFKCDIAVLMLHGPYGEDGSIQSLLESVNIPYTGCNMLSSAVCMDKIVTKKILSYHKLPTPKWVATGLNNSKLNDIYNSIVKSVRFPAVLKPVNQGSAVGVYIVNSKPELNTAVESLKQYGNAALVEKYIKGREFTVGIIGNEPLAVVEIIPVGEKFYNYESKYSKGKSKHIMPADLPASMTKKLQQLAVDTFNALGCRAVSRIDFLIDTKKNPYILECNTIPGMTETSLLPEAAKHAGISFIDLILKIIKYSLK